VKRRYLAAFAIWTAIGLFMWSQEVARGHFFGDPTPSWHLLVSWLGGVWTDAIATPWVFALADRFPLERKRWPRNAAIHAGVSVVFAAASIAIATAISMVFGFYGALPVDDFATTFWIAVIVSGHNLVVVYLAIIAVRHAMRYYRNLRQRERQALELETELARAQLGALKVQIQPHFLYNTLNAIAALVRAGRGADAEEMLGRLGELLRRVLDDVDAQQVSLRRELEYVQLYLSIEQVRFGDRLIVHTDADPSTLDAQVPQLGLQPIVENAVRHGVGRSASPVTIRIAARRANGSLELEVADDGPGLADPPSTRGIGLANTRARIATLYGDAASLTVAPTAPRGVTVTITMPYEVA
jgi:anti-sigma regulatory factor (Ser/Thr protein kinase)